MNKNLQDALKKAAEWNVASFERKGKDFNFSDVYPLIVKTHQALLDFRDNPDFWNQLPPTPQNSLLQRLIEAIRQIEMIGQFNPTRSSNPTNDRNQLVSQFTKVYADLYRDFFLPLEIYLIKKRLEDSNPTQLTQEAREVLEDIKGQKAEAATVVGALREASLSASTSKFSSIFEKQAKRNRTLAIVWLIATTLFGLMLSHFVKKYFLNYFNEDYLKSFGTLPPLEFTLPLIISKFVFISVLTVFFYQFIKNLNSNMHLFMINRHKANCLNTLQAIVESSDDPRTREAVIMQASKAIFELNETGLISSKEKEITGLESIRIIDQFKQ